MTRGRELAQNLRPRPYRFLRNDLRPRTVEETMGGLGYRVRHGIVGCGLGLLLAGAGTVAEAGVFFYVTDANAPATKLALVYEQITPAFIAGVGSTFDYQYYVLN